MKINEWKCNLGPFGGWRRGEQISDLSNNAVQVLVGWIYALLLWGFADMLPEPDAKWEPTWDAMRACAWLCVCFWVHSPAVSFCTDHINDKTEAWATGCSLKREWGKKCERKRSQSVEEYETPKENENWSLKIWELKKWKYTKTAQATTWLSTCWTTIFPLALSSSFPSLSSPPARLSVPLGTRTSSFPPSHCHRGSAALALLLLMLQFCWVGLISPLPHRKKVIPPSHEWWWTEGRRWRGGSIWLVNFNAEADVSLCTWWDQWAGKRFMLWSYEGISVVAYLLSRGCHPNMSTCGSQCWWKWI